MRSCLRLYASRCTGRSGELPPLLSGSQNRHPRNFHLWRFQQDRPEIQRYLGTHPRHTGLLRQVTGGFPTYRSGEKASELDAILHNEDAEGCRRFKTRVFWPKALPMGHGIVVLRARKARLLQNDVTAASQRTIPTRAFKQSTGEASLRIPAHNSHPAISSA